MKILSQIAIILSAFFAAVGFASCSTDNNYYGQEIPDNVIYSIVTFVSSGDQGTVFEFRKNGDSELITLTAPIKVDTEQLKPGTRVIICYLPSGGQAVYQSGPITLYGGGIYRIFNGIPEVKPLNEILSMRRESLNLRTISRSGNYIDISAQPYGAGTQYKLNMYVDEATVDSDYPATYLVYSYDDINAGRRDLNASFDISELLTKPTCKGVSVTYDGQSKSETVRFDKDTVLPIQPVE